MSDIRWEEPPMVEELPWAQRTSVAGATTRWPDWPAVAVKLRSRPGRWAWVASYSTYAGAQKAASDIGLGKLRKLGPGFSAVQRLVDGEHRVYARYIGGAS